MSTPSEVTSASILGSLAGGMGSAQRLPRSPFAGPLRAVIFDWAGTTVDFGSRAPVTALIRLFEGRGIVLSEAQARSAMGQHKRDHIRAMCQLEDIAAAFQVSQGRPWNEGDIDALYAALLPLTLEAARTTSRLIPGIAELSQALRQRGLRIGSTTGYNAEMMAEIAPLAAAQGYAPDCIVTVSDVPAGRPAPWMCFRSAERLGVYPPAACVKVGDTPADIAEGRNAGMWTIALAGCGNEVGLSESALSALPAGERAERVAAARARLQAHHPDYIVDAPTVEAILPCLDDIAERLSRGEYPA